MWKNQSAAESCRNVTRVIQDFRYAVNSLLWVKHVFSAITDACSTCRSGVYAILGTQKITKNHTKRYILRMCVGAPRNRLLLFLAQPGRDTDDVINHEKYCIDRFRGFGLVKSQIWSPPILRNHNDPYNCVTVAPWAFDHPHAVGRAFEAPGVTQCFGAPVPTGGR